MKVVDILKGDGVVILPTDTLYALSAKACSDTAVKKLISIKKRPDSQALPILVKNIFMAEEYGVFNPKAKELANLHWPGALTLIVPLRQNVNISKFVTKGNDSIAIRVPKSSVVLSIINELNAPVVGTSANISGQNNLLSKEELDRQFKDVVDGIIYADKFSAVASTIIDCTTNEPKIIRQGDIKI